MVTPELPTPAATPRGISRRSVVVGAAWAAPVVAAAVATPLAAASMTPTLAFELPTYGGVTCGTVNGITATMTTDGTTPSAGQPVSIELTGGYTFADGAATWTGVTNEAGTVMLPGVIVPAGAAPGDVIATAGALTASASLTATLGGAAFFKDADGPRSFASVPAGSTAAGRSAFLAPNGDLYLGDTVVASGVTAATADVNSAGQTIIGFIAGGVASCFGPTGEVRAFDSIPAGATPIGRDTYLAPDGTLWVGDVMVATGVTSATARPNSADETVIGFVADGVASFYGPTEPISTYASVPAGSIAVGGNVYLAPDGDLYEGNTIIASSVTAAYADLNSADRNYIGYVSGGVAYYRGPRGGLTALVAVPANSAPIGRNVFLAPNGHLYEGDTLVTTGASSARALFTSNNESIIGFVASSGC